MYLLALQPCPLNQLLDLLLTAALWHNHCFRQSHSWKKMLTAVNQLLLLGLPLSCSSKRYVLLEFHLRMWPGLWRGAPSLSSILIHCTSGAWSSSPSPSSWPSLQAGKSPDRLEKELREWVSSPSSWHWCQRRRQSQAGDHAPASTIATGSSWPASARS